MTAVVFGGTGLVGSHLIDLLLKDDDYAKVISISRRPVNIQHKKWEEIIIDFDNLEHLTLPDNVNHAYLCLGTTMAKAGSKAAFYKIDFTYTSEAAKWAKNHGAQKVTLVSAIGASVKSWFYYSKVKGKIEENIIALDYSSTVIIRPSLLLGARKEYRKGEVMAERISQYLGFLYFGSMQKYKPVRATDVAKKMVLATKKINKKLEIIESQNI